MTSDRIDHAAEARRLLDLVPASMHKDEVFAVSQVHATLALVEQQRIHNLVALAQGGHGVSMGVENIALDALRELHSSDNGPWAEQTVKLRPEIREALGIDE